MHHFLLCNVKNQVLVATYWIEHLICCYQPIISAYLYQSGSKSQPVYSLENHSDSNYY